MTVILDHNLAQKILAFHPSHSGTEFEEAYLSTGASYLALRSLDTFQAEFVGKMRLERTAAAAADAVVDVAAAVVDVAAAAVDVAAVDAAAVEAAAVDVAVDVAAAVDEELEIFLASFAAAVVYTFERDVRKNFEVAVGFQIQGRNRAFALHLAHSWLVVNSARLLGYHFDLNFCSIMVQPDSSSLSDDLDFLYFLLPIYRKANWRSTWVMLALWWEFVPTIEPTNYSKRPQKIPIEQGANSSILEFQRCPSTSPL